MAKTSPKTTKSAAIKSGRRAPMMDRKARQALLALGALVEGLPPTVMIGDMPQRVAAFKAAVAELTPKETKRGRR